MNSFVLHDALTNKPPTMESDFAPTRQELIEIQLRLNSVESSEAKTARRLEFFRKYPETRSLAQLNIRVEFLELLSALKQELRQIGAEE
jgi:hypothetical protein